ncbi:esterase/lipase family protein [Haloechinothrix halophila]|uniref:esterase/lipase family protein n=1 Tax=Haloechinothrix halophila TaxID=1069073 RepID=UPI00041D2C0D|nr:alpha/beta fold hydrolase [Haloechinothrix halophila]
MTLRDQIRRRGATSPSRRLVLLLSVAALAFGSLFAAPAAAAADRNPVVFVHGWSSSSSAWDEMVADFKAAGYTDSELYAWDYNSGQSNKTTAKQLATLIDDVRATTGAAQVDVVTHSMGGLNSRWYVKFLDGTNYVDDWVSLAGPNHGTNSAYWCWTTSCYEMRPGSNFLTKLNAGDETPGSVDYGTWWSSCDGVINPDDSVLLDGAKNTWVGCISHSAFLSNDAVSQDVRDFVAAT